MVEAAPQGGLNNQITALAWRTVERHVVVEQIH